MEVSKCETLFLSRYSGLSALCSYQKLTPLFTSNRTLLSRKQIQSELWNFLSNLSCFKLLCALESIFKARAISFNLETIIGRLKSSLASLMPRCENCLRFVGLQERLLICKASGIVSRLLARSKCDKCDSVTLLRKNGDTWWHYMNIVFSYRLWMWMKRTRK